MIAPMSIPSSYALPGLMDSVLPILIAPLLSWMWPWSDRSGWCCSIAARTAVDPTGRNARLPCRNYRCARKAGVTPTPDLLGVQSVYNYLFDRGVYCNVILSIRHHSAASESLRRVLYDTA